MFTTILVLLAIFLVALITLVICGAGLVLAVASHLVVPVVIIILALTLLRAVRSLFKKNP